MGRFCPLEVRRRRRFDDPFEQPLRNADLDDGELPSDDFEEMRFEGPMPELALGGQPVEGHAS